MEIGSKAPAVLGINEKGETIGLDKFAGKKLVLYFYPKDNTPGCTQEACSLRDGYDELLAHGYEVVGVSPDSATSHQRFIAKHSLPFTLIADTDKTLAETFGVWGEKKMCGRTYMGIHRTTFVIDENGVIERILGPKQVKVKEHARQIIG